MKIRASKISAVLAAVCVTGISSLALASSHREAPAIANDPAADNTDLYAWVEGSNLVVLANYIPLEEPAGGPNFHSFSDEVRYEIHIVHGASSLKDSLTYYVTFDSTGYPHVDPKPNAAVGGGAEFFSQISGNSQTYTVKRVDKNGDKVLVKGAKVAPANIGPRTNALAYQTGGATYENFFVGGAGNVITSLGAGEGRVFAGPRDDGFYVDLGGVFDLAGLRILPSIANNPNYGAKQKTAVDGVAGFNTHTIALEIPLDKANGAAIASPGTPNNANTIGVWASASRRKVSVLRADGSTETYGPWRQVSRLGLPLINEAVIGLQDKDSWNRDTPQDDLNDYGGYFLNPVVVRDAEFAGLYDAANPDGVLSSLAGNLAALKGNRMDIINIINLTDIPSKSAHSITSIGDVLRVDLGIPSGFPNGRPIAKGTNHEQADVTDVLLSVLLTGGAAPVPDAVNSNDKTFRSDFPYLASPWEGFSEGHGKPAP
jgi:hypothetical protein